jgi:hypothetical protein
MDVKYMKLPEVLFVKHCPNLAPERKTFLETYLEERVPIKDVRWFEDYNHDHPFVEWLNVTHELPYGMKLTSNLVKTMMMYKQMIDENIETALFMDDDVVFHKDWVEYFESIPDDIKHIGFLNMGVSFMYNFKPKLGKVYSIPNNGGCECSWVTLEFAKYFMENLNMKHALDIIWYGVLHSLGQPLLYLPVCHQTSTIKNSSTLEHETRSCGNWIEFVKAYKDSDKVDLNQLLKQFEESRERKKKLEDKFFEIYGKHVDIKSVKYINGDTRDHSLNILDF